MCGDYLRLRALQSYRDSKNHRHTVMLGREFIAVLHFDKFSIERNVLITGESLSTPCYTRITRPAKRHHYSDASSDEIVSYRPEKKLYLDYDLARQVIRRTTEEG